MVYKSEKSVNAPKTKMLQSHLPNTGSYQIRNFTHGYPGL